MEYTIPKPSYPVSAILYALAVGMGLFGLGWVAVETFGLFHVWPVAVPFGLVIEIGAISEAIGLVMAFSGEGNAWEKLKRSGWIIPGLIITLGVSGGYNYLTALRAGALLTPPVTEPAILAAVGVGPLSAVFFIAAQLGVKIKEHEDAVKDWELEKQKWFDGKAKEAEETKERQAESARQLALQQTQLQLDAQARAQAAELASQEKRHADELAAQERKARADRRAAARAAKKASQDSVQSTEASVNLHKGTYEDFKAAMKSNGSHEITAQEIHERWKVSVRTGFVWLKRYDDENA